MIQISHSIATTVICLGCAPFHLSWEKESDRGRLQHRKGKKGKREGLKKDRLTFVQVDIFALHSLQILVGSSVMMLCLGSREMTGVALARATRVVMRRTATFMVMMAWFR
jgi:hypothetical protein